MESRSGFHPGKRIKSLFIKSKLSFQQMMIFFVSSYFLSSCTPDSLPVSVKGVESKLAVSSLVGPMGITLVTLSRTFSALAESDIYLIEDEFLDNLLIDSALVTISHKGGIDTLTNAFDVPGLYGAILGDLEEGDVLQLSVYDSTTSQSVTAVSQYLPPAKVDSVIITETEFYNGTIYQHVELQIEDEEDPDYYIVHAYRLSPYGSDPDSSGTGLFFDDNGYLIYESLFTDVDAVDNILKKKFMLPHVTPEDSAFIVLTHIEEGYYRFLDARRRTGDIFSSLFNEPVNHPTNISNGAGYFSAHEPQVFFIPPLKED